MDDFKNIFEEIDDTEIMYNMMMFMLTYFVNKGLMEIHWNMDKEQFVYVVATDEEEEKIEEKKEIDIDPDDILRKMLNRRKK